METLLTLLVFAVGLAIVIKGSGLFVASSVAIGVHARLPRAVIGGTLVSLATTAPELTVSATASAQGNPGLAVGNAVGSAIGNIGVILGVLCILRPMDVKPRDFRFPAFAMLAAGFLLTGLTVTLRLGRLRGAALVTCGVAYLALDWWRHRRRGRDGPHAATAAEAPAMSLRRSIGLFILGAAMVVLGSRLVSDSAVKLAALAGVPPMIIGLTLVAIGTSLPELVTAVASARRGVPELSLGNVVGANIMNITLITGVSAVIRPLTLTRTTQLYNFPAMIIFFLLLLAVARTGRRLTRKEGGVFVLFYIAYVIGLVLLRG